MEVHEDIAKWLKDMGYEGKVPANLLSICNPQTSHIWTQLIATVRPREEAETVKLNVILNRLKTKPIDQQECFLFKVKEIEAYNYRLSIEQKLKQLKQTVEMSNHNVKKTYAKYKMKEMALKVSKSKVEESEDRQFLLESKMELLKQQHLEAEQLLSKLESVIPEEEDQSSTTKEISTILEQCSLKLQRLVMEDEELKMEEITNISMQSNIRLKQSLRTPQSGHQTPYETRDDQESGIFPFALEEGSFFKSPRFTNSTPMRYKSQSFLDFNGSIPAPLNGAQESLFKVPDTTLMKKSLKSDHPLSRKLYNYPEVSKECGKILHKHDVGLIYETLEHLNRNIVTELETILQEKRPQAYQVEDKKILDRDLAKLAFTHVDTQMKIQKQSREMDELVLKINSRKRNILTSLTAESNKAQLAQKLERALQQITLKTTMAVRQREISQQFNTSRVESEKLTSKVQKIKSEINNKLQLIQIMTKEMSDTVKYMGTNQHSISNAKWGLRSFTFDSSWINSLMNSTWMKEMRVFQSVPLDYQRQCTNSKLFYRDLSPALYTNAIQMGPQEMELLANILDSPFDAPETILLKITKAKIKLDALKAMSNLIRQNFDGERKYSFDELVQQESYLIDAQDSLKGLALSPKSYETLTASEVVKHLFEIWIEAPMADFISDDQTVDGHNYQYFKKRLANLM